MGASGAARYSHSTLGGLTTEQTMPSPFPGMNPFLEQEDAWHDFHERFMPLAAELLNAQVGPSYIVKIDEHVYIHDLETEERTFAGRADVAVTGRPAAGASAATGLLEAPVQVQLPPVDVERESSIEIRDRRNRQLITVIELLSPSNKAAGRDRDQYVAKRHTLTTGPVHFVELDLLRGGPRMPFVSLPPCAYYAMVSRAGEHPLASLWPVHLRDRLPVNPAPLRAPDPDVHLDLQDVLHRIYDAAGYAKFIYDSNPAPPLGPADDAWARSLLPTNS